MIRPILDLSKVAKMQPQTAPREFDFAGHQNLAGNTDNQQDLFAPRKPEEKREKSCRI